MKKRRGWILRLLAQLREVWYVERPDLSVRRMEFIQRILLRKAGSNGKN